MRIVKSTLIIDIIKSKQLISSIENVGSGSSESTGVKGVNKSHKVTLADGTNWLMKPQSGDHTSRWRHIPPKSQYRRERAAYLTNRQLGFNLVPLTKIVKHDSDISSMQSWIEDVEDSDVTLNKYSSNHIWMAGLFDIIIGNSDRHRWNWLTLGNKPILIDNGYSMPNEADYDDPRSVILSRFSCRIWDKRIPQIFLEKIKLLKNTKFQIHIKSLLDPPAFQLFNERVDQLITTGIAKVDKYLPKEKIRGIPPKKGEV